MKQYWIALILILAAGIAYLLTARDGLQLQPTETNQSSAPGPSENTPRDVPKVDTFEDETIGESQFDSEFFGRVYHVESGEPVSNVTVDISRLDGQPGTNSKLVSDKDGRFELGMLEPGNYQILAYHKTLLSEFQNYEMIISHDEPLSDFTIGMVSAGVITGRVYNTDTDEGISRVRIWMEEQSPGIMTDAEGYYRFGKLREGETRVFVGTAKGYVDDPSRSNGLNVSVTQGRESSDVNFAFEPILTTGVEGKVVDAQGFPVADARVTLRSRSGGGGWDRPDPVETRPDGIFQFKDLQVVGGLFLDARIVGAKSEPQGPLLLTMDGIHDVVLTLHPTGSISGKVIDSVSGMPILDSKLQVESRREEKGIRNTIAVSLNRRGEFKFGDLSQGQYGLNVHLREDSWGSFMAEPLVMVDLEEGENFGNVELLIDYQELLRSVEEQADLNRQNVATDDGNGFKVGRVRGRVVRAESGEAVTTFRLFSFPGRSKASRPLYYEEGVFFIEEQNGSSLQIEISAKGFATEKMEISGGEGEQPVHDVTIAMQRGGVVDGRVVDKALNPVSGAKIMMGKEDVRTMVETMFIREREPLAWSGSDGSFTLDTLPETTTRITAIHPSFVDGSVDVNATRNRISSVQIVLSRGGSIEGTVQRLGEPVASQRVIADGDRKGGASETDSAGRFLIENLEPGIYSVYTREGLSESDKSQAEVADGMITEVNFDFGVLDNSLSGFILLDRDFPVSTSVQADISTDGGTEHFESESERAGTYQLRKLPMGDAEITVHATLEDGTTTTQKFTMSIKEGANGRNFDLRSAN